MKLKAKVTINTGLYMDIRPEVEIDVPDDLKNQDLVRWLHKEYHGILVKPEVCESCGGTAGINGKGIVDPIINGLHKKCRETENWKRKDL